MGIHPLQIKEVLITRQFHQSNLYADNRMKSEKLFAKLDNKIQGILIVALFIWNTLEGAVFENVYPVAMVKLYKYPIWRVAFVLLVIFSADWSPLLSIMIAFTLFFYIMDIEVTREKWSVSELKRSK